MNNEWSEVFTLLACVVLVIAFLILFIIKFMVSVYFPFVDEYDNIKNKILFSTHHDEREYWRREKKRLYVSYIPFMGGFLARKMKARKKKY